MSSHRTPNPSVQPPSGSLGFTVVELLVVIAIIGGLALISLPAIKGLTQSHNVANASQQLLDDLALARRYAINNRSVVHVLFVPPAITNLTAMNFPVGQDLPKRLMTGIYSTYAIYAERTVGDQPGQPRARYLSRWKSLPEGVVIAPREFTFMPFRAWDAGSDPLTKPLRYSSGFRFPTITNDPVGGTIQIASYDDPRRPGIPHITFDPQGRVLVTDPVGNRKHRDEVIELARGSVLASRDPSTGDLLHFDFRESPPDNSINNYNRIRIDGLTGRAILERPEIGQPQLVP